jgi:hypothetical protein
MESEIDIFGATPNNIWNFRQNHPELVVDDCRAAGFSDVQLKIVRQSMLVRGINKWLKVRRDLIAHKKRLKHEIKSQTTAVQNLKKETQKLYCRPIDVAECRVDPGHYANYCRARQNYLIAKERLKWLENERGVLRRLCKTDRWQIWQEKRIEHMNTIRASGN